MKFQEIDMFKNVGKCKSAGALMLTLSVIALASQNSVSQTPTSDPTFSKLPGYGLFNKVLRSRGQVATGGRVQKVQWAADHSKLSFVGSNGRKVVDLESGEFVDAAEFKVIKREPVKPRRRGLRVPRAEQRPIEPSNDGKWDAVYQDFNVKIVPRDKGQEAVSVTTDGNVKVRFGTGCWVYGEELSQSTAMWWSPDDRFLAFYRVDEQHMRDYHLTIDNAKSYTKLQTVRYPKAGDPNPKVKILIYELATRKTVEAIIEGEETQYLYDIRWTPDGTELLVNRTNRHQDILDVFAVDPATGDSRIVVTEKQEAFQENSPVIKFLSDRKRFVWETEKNGWKNYELRDLKGKFINKLTQAEDYPVSQIQVVDEKNGWFYFTAYSDKNPYNIQLHRTRLDGTEHVRITTMPLHHSAFIISPDNKWVIATCENVNTPPKTVLYDATGKMVLELEVADVDDENSKMITSELFEFISADGKTVIYGTLHKPTNFDPSKKYPLLIDVYGGPGSRGLSNRFNPANPYCEFGYCIAKIGNRGTIERGKAFETATYLKLGEPDLLDQADGVKFLSKRDYIDGSRVGIYGHSYGGYMSALAVLKFPEVFHVAVSGAPVTTWENYDTIYTERYMRTPQENRDGYENGSCMKYAENLSGKLLLVHGLIDDNVHPANTWQLVNALHAANKRFDMQIYPGFKHGIGSTYSQIRWEYFHKHLKPTFEKE